MAHHYRRKITAAGTKYEKSVWICGTFNTYGKEACDSQQIPEDILKEKAGVAIHFDGNFDEHLFAQIIKEIQVPEAGKIIFVYHSGSEPREITWQNKSRKHSWTPEMREAARQRQLAKNQAKEGNE